MKNIEISIITVNYKVGEKIKKCLLSIEKHFKNINYEVIIVENEVSANFKNQFEAHRNVTYIKSKRNIGFGAGNNLGAKIAKGEYLFFLNPDTTIEKGSIIELLKLFRDKKTGVVAPLLLDKQKKPYKKQGTLKLTPLRAIFSLSFIYKYFPKNFIARSFWLESWNKKTVKEVDVVPGTAFVIRRNIFQKIKGFDEKFFLYFEESDLCNRVKEIGYNLYITPSLQVIHEWGKSTEQMSNISDIFDSSRKYYFKKNYGAFGYVTNILLSPSLKKGVLVGVFITVVLLTSLFLRTWKLRQVMQFIADQGWFYLAARDMIVSGTIPLVGNYTSHPWLHHGPLWTYTLGILLYLFHFDPIAPAYFMGILGTITVGVFFTAVSRMFSLRVGVLSVLLYATSPLLVMNSRLPYHTSPIPLFVILLFFMTYLWINGKKYCFSVICFLLAVLYNHEITTFVFAIAIIMVFAYGVVKKKEWIKRTLSKKVIILSLVMFIIPMTPFIMYDVGHGYHQTLGFLAWVIYRIVKAPLGLINNKYISSGSNPSTVSEFTSYYTQLIFQPSAMVSAVIGVASIFFTFWSLLQSVFKKVDTQYVILFLFLIVSLLGLFVHRVPIEADTLLIAPFIILLTSLMFLWICRQKFIPALALILLIIIGNTCFLLLTDFQTKMGVKSKSTFIQKITAVNEVIYLSDNKPYNIVGRGELSDLPVFLDGYKYLLWYKGHPDSSIDQKRKIQVWELGNKIVVKRIK